MFPYGAAVPVTLYCLHHAKKEHLVLAVGKEDGCSTCGQHGGGEPARLILGKRRAQIPYPCAHCHPQTPHPAYFLVSNEFLCIRHAADAAFPDDDMGAHDMAHAAYLALNLRSIRDVY